MVEALGDQLLSGAAFADHEDWAIERGRPARSLDRVEKGKALPNETFRPLHTPTIGDKSHDLARFFAAFSPLKTKQFRKSDRSSKMARILNSKEQVQALIFEYRSD